MTNDKENKNAKNFMVILFLAAAILAANYFSSHKSKAPHSHDDGKPHTH